MKNLFLSIASVTAAASLLCAQPPVPVEPVSAIIDGFRSHPVVALGNIEGGNQQSHAFQLALLRDSRFTAVPTAVLVEFGNALYQDVIDRFVRGEEVPYDSLRRVWQNTTQVETEWDLPIYEEFFRTVRAVNASLPQARQLRILLGDPPIDWDHIHTPQDYQAAIGDRDGYALDVLRREVLAKGRRALIIYGGQHLLRRNTVPGAADEWAGGIIARMEKDHLAAAFTILPETRRDLRALESDVATWPVPSLAIVRGTNLGATLWDPRPQRRPVRTEEQIDAILYLGPPSSMTAASLSSALCSDRTYIEMRLWRLALIPPPPGAAVTPAAQLKAYCGRLNQQ